MAEVRIVIKEPTLSDPRIMRAVRALIRAIVKNKKERDGAK